MGKIFKHVIRYIDYLLTDWRKFEHELCIAAIIKNEAPYLREWIEFHKLVGVEKFVIYDNESTDNTKEVFQPYINSGEVEYIPFPGKVMQLKAYNNAVKRYRHKTKWLAMIDADEFIVPVKHAKITDLLKEMGNPPGLVVSWVNYGYNGHRQKPDGLVMKNYTKNDGTDVSIKSIVNPRTVLHFINPHRAQHFFGKCPVNEIGEALQGSYYDDVSRASAEKIRINHYFTKSYDEFIEKTAKGRADTQRKNDLPEFEPDFLSHIEDNIADKYIPLLEEKLSIR